MTWAFFPHHIYINDNFVDRVIVFIPVFKNLTLEELSFDIDTLRPSLAYARVCMCVSQLTGNVLRNTNFTQLNERGELLSSSWLFLEPKNRNQWASVTTGNRDMPLGPALSLFPITPAAASFSPRPQPRLPYKLPLPLGCALSCIFITYGPVPNSKKYHVLSNAYSNNHGLGVKVKP